MRDQRNRQAASRAEPHLPEGEAVEDWVRVKHSDVRREGFAYVTERRLLIEWQGRSDDHEHFTWEEVVSWGIEPEADGGPILCIETDDQATKLQMPARSHAVARRVSSFLRSFGKKAPSPKRSLARSDPKRFIAHAEVDVARQRRSAFGQTKRIAITIIGVALITLAILIIPLPGPWSILLTLGGLAVLAREYDWAQDLADFFRDKYKDARDKIKSRRSSTS